MKQLKALGLRIAVDDFGTGYSALSHLQQFRCPGTGDKRIGRTTRVSKSPTRLRNAALPEPTADDRPSTTHTATG